MSYVGCVRRDVKELAKSIGLPGDKVEKASIIASEMATNLAKHAEQGGEILISRESDGPDRRIELICIDHGPGIGCLEESSKDGCSTSDTMGGGLGAIKRLSDHSEICSTPSKGTIIRACLFASTQKAASNSSVEIGALSIPHPRETVCGDGVSFAINDDIVSVIVLDGLGHGPGAAEAQQLAIESFNKDPFAGPEVQLARIHTELAGTRGAAIATLTIDLGTNILKYVGVGNIAGRLHRRLESDGCLSTCGIVGSQLGNIKPQEYKWEKGATLLLHSDGIKTAASIKGFGSLSATMIAATIFRDFARTTDDATVVVVKDLRTDWS